ARSSVGIHGFACGGFLVEAGQRTPGTIAPLVARVSFPDPWRIVLVLPADALGLHDSRESDAFAQLRASPMAWTDVLCRLVVLGMLPALAEGDLNAFGEAAFEFNARAGEVFAPIQGGTYAGYRTAELVGFLRRQGVRGVGQSSWGPGVFAIVGDAEQAG